MSWAGLLATLVLLQAAPAAGQHQHHHASGGGEAEIGGFAATAGIGVELGQVEAFGESHDYQALSLSADARARRFEVAARVPIYRLDVGDESHAGLGDVHLEARWIALARPFQAGLTAAVMPPLGSDEHGLAMGHWMLMGGAFAGASRGRASGSLALAYGSQLGDGGHAAHGMPVWPPVAPMNEREIRGALAARITLWRTVAAVASAMAAAPVGNGELLALAGGGLAAGMGRFDLGVDVAHGLAGHTAGLVIGSHLLFAF